MSKCLQHLHAGHLANPLNNSMLLLYLSNSETNFDKVCKIKILQHLSILHFFIYNKNHFLLKKTALIQYCIKSLESLSQAIEVPVIFCQFASIRSSLARGTAFRWSYKAEAKGNKQIQFKIYTFQIAHFKLIIIPFVVKHLV